MENNIDKYLEGILNGCKFTFIPNAFRHWTVILQTLNSILSQTKNNLAFKCICLQLANKQLLFYAFVLDSREWGREALIK